MKVQLKGINPVPKTLADGSRVTYYYAWKGGPRLRGKPGSPEFVDDYKTAIATKAAQPSNTIQSILNAYQQSPSFLELAKRTRLDYVRMIRKIETEYGNFPISELTDRRARGEILTWRDRLAIGSPRQADYALTVFALILSWALDRGLVPMNPCKRPGKAYRSKRVDNIWTSDDEARFMKTAPAHMRLAFMMALWTGQRQGDLLRLTWNAYDGDRIQLKQRKTGVRVTVPVGAPLKELLDSTKKTTVTILATTRNTAWTESGFRASWRTACQTAGIKDLTFHDLRGTAVTRLAIAECTTAEIATITGHSLKQAASIVDTHYLKRDSALGISAIRKREKYESRTKTPN